MKQLLIFYEFPCQGLYYSQNMLFFILRKKNQTKQENMIKVFKVLLKRYNYENASDDPLF